MSFEAWSLTINRHDLSEFLLALSPLALLKVCIVLIIIPSPSLLFIALGPSAIVHGKVIYISMNNGTVHGDVYKVIVK